MLESKRSSQLVVARLLEFFADKSAWFRGLWDVGPVLLLDEALEAARASPTGELFHKAEDWTGSGYAEDPGIAPRERNLLRPLLQSRLHMRGGELPAVERIARTIESAYLLNWAQWLKTADPSKLNAERIARAVASHLLDRGFSPDFLHRWLTYRTVRDPKEYSLIDLVEEAHEHAVSPEPAFEVLVPVLGGFGDPTRQRPAQWRTPPQVAQWLAEKKFERDVRQGGGWALHVRAHDAFAAARAAGAEVERLSARIFASAGRKQRLHDYAYVYALAPSAGEEGERSRSTEVQLRRRRRVSMPSLHGVESLLETSAMASQVDAALELLAQVDGPDVVAAAAGWAAVEALMSPPPEEKKSVALMAAEHLARLVACSFPRAELTLLAALQLRAKPASPLATQLRQCRSNHERAALVAKAIKAETPQLVWDGHEHEAAVSRMRRLLKQPGTRLKDIHGYAHRAFLRLYRQRNLVLHAGMTSSVALRASLRTAVPLLAAGVDRAAQAWFSDQVSPLELAVRAQHRLEALKDKADEPEDLLGILE